MTGSLARLSNEKCVPVSKKFRMRCDQRKKTGGPTGLAQVRQSWCGTEIVKEYMQMSCGPRLQRCTCSRKVCTSTKISGRRTSITPDAAAALVLGDKPKRVRRKKKAFDIFESDYGNKQQCMQDIQLVAEFLKFRRRLNVCQLRKPTAEEQSRLCGSAAESRRMKRVAPPTESAQLAQKLTEACRIGGC